MSDSVRPQRWQPTRLHRPWDSPGKNTGVGCHFLLQCMKVKSESEVLSRVWLLATPWTAAHQAPPPMGFSRQEYWSEVPLPSPSCYLTSAKSREWFRAWHVHFRCSVNDCGRRNYRYMALVLYFKTENNFIFGVYNFAHLSYYFPIGKVTHH